MKRLILIIITGLVVMMCLSYAQAAVYTFRPSPNDLSDLAHQYYYTWAIGWSIPTGQVIKEATLTYYNIYDWTNEPNDRLYTHLLDNPDKNPIRNRRGIITGYSNVTRSWDNEGGGDNFSGQGVLVGNWTDPLGGYPRGFNLVYNFSSLGLIDDLTAYLSTPYNLTSQGNFGFGIDPDCHYYNNYTEFRIVTGPAVPEPATISLLGLGLLLKVFKIKNKKMGRKK